MLDLPHSITYEGKNYHLHDYTCDEKAESVRFARMDETYAIVFRTHPYPKRLEFLKAQETASCVYRGIRREITEATRKPSRGSSGNF